VNFKVIANKFVEVGLVLDAFNDEFAVTNIAESLVFVALCDDLGLANLQHVDNEHY